MRSTRRIEGVAGWLLLALVVVGTAWGLAHLPPGPAGPRWAGAGEARPRSGGTFVFYGSSNVRTLDPHIAYDELSNMAVRLVFDGLLDYDLEGRIVPSLAESLPSISEDGRTFRFVLRRGVRFHHGRELSAEDVRWSLEHLLASDTGSPGVPFFLTIAGAQEFHEGRARSITGVRVIDRYTIDITLTQPDQTFLNAMAMTFAYPVAREVYERWGSQVGAHPVGTGPFVFDRWERGVQLEFERNRAYFRRDHVGPDRMIYLEGIDVSLAVPRFRNGDLDVLHGMTNTQYLFFKGSREWRPYFHEMPSVTVTGLVMNCEMAPFDDVHVRRAVSFAIDREARVRMANRRIRAAGQMLPPQIAGYDEHLPNLQHFDLEAARREMALAGHPDGLPDEVTVTVGEGPGGLLSFAILQEDLRRIGIRIRPRQVSFATYLDETARPRTSQAFFSGWNMDFPDPSNFLDILLHSRSIRPENSENRSFYRNPELDRVLDEARSERDPGRRVALYRQANDLVARDAPWAFTSYPLKTELHQAYVHGYVPHPVWSQDYRNVWLDLPRRRLADRARGTGRFGAALAPLGGRR